MADYQKSICLLADTFVFQVVTSATKAMEDWNKVASITNGYEQSAGYDANQYAQVAYHALCLVVCDFLQGHLSQNLPSNSIFSTLTSSLMSCCLW